MLPVATKIEIHYTFVGIISSTKNFKKLSLVASLFNITQERETMFSKILKITQNLCDTVPFSLTLQPCSPEYLTSVNTYSKKNVSFEGFEIVWSF